MILEQAKETIAQNGWKRLLLAVSGGLDSMCLAHFFVSNQEALGIEWLGIAHVHHGLREASADLDAALVQQFAEEHHVPFFLKRLNGEKLKAMEGSLENNARKGRYEALEKIARSPIMPGMTSPEVVIVTAHHANDQAETVYMRLRRGVSLAGLSGIRMVRKNHIKSDSSPVIFRPFLNTTRKELSSYAQAHHLRWREDESNQDTSFTRNKIRHDSLPHLESTNSGAIEQLCRIAALSAAAYGKILAAGDSLFKPLVVSPCDCPPLPTEILGCSRILLLDTRKGKVSLLNGKDEIFRLWLDSQGFRFPLGTFRGKALVNDMKNLSYRCRFIHKSKHFVWICERNPVEFP